VTAAVRLFVALEIDSSLRPGIAAIQDSLRASNADVAWTRPEQWHLTIRFLGDADESGLPGIVDALHRAASTVPPFTMHVRGLGTFPGGRRPRVAWLGIEDLSGHRLSLLAGAVERGLGVLGFPPEGRAFRPHLTLGRIRSARGVERLQEIIAAHASADVGTSLARELTLFQSELLPGGARYTALATSALQG